MPDKQPAPGVVMPGTHNAHKVAQRMRAEALVLNAIKANGPMTSKSLAILCGTKHVRMTRRMIDLQDQGLVVRLGVTKAESTWALAEDEDALVKAKAANDRKAQIANEDLKESFIHRIVPAATRKAPRYLGPRWVFDLAQSS